MSEKTTRRNNRVDHQKGLRTVYLTNRKKVLAAASICPLCGKPLDKKIKPPDPYAPEVDHIIPVSRGGDATSLDNLQAVHRICNERKADKLIPRKTEDELKAEELIGNQDLPLHYDWTEHRTSSADSWHQPDDSADDQG